MSTNAIIRFTAGEEVIAHLYQHADGYPDGEHGVPATLERFFDAIESQTGDTRYTDPAYLAARFVVFSAYGNSRHASCEHGYARSGDRAAPHAHGELPCLAFLSIGVVSDTYSGEYVYTVDCARRRGGHVGQAHVPAPGSRPPTLLLPR